MRVHLLQYDISWHQAVENSVTVDRLLSGLDLKSDDWIILPEMWSTGFTMTPDMLEQDQLALGIEFLQQYSLDHQVHLCGSHALNDGDHWRNRFFHYYAGELEGFYDKRYLFSPAGENNAYRAGQKPVLWTSNDVHIRPFICYDLRFAPWSFTPSAQVLIYVANWPATRIDQWDALLKARAIENQAYVIGVNRIGQDQNELNYVGHSAVYGYNGQCISLSQDQESVQSLTLDITGLNAYRAQLPFLQDR